MEPPKNIKQLRGFVGAINYYRDMWPHRSYTMAPLTSQTGALKKGKIKIFESTDKVQDAFIKTKTWIATVTMLAYPDHNKSFHIYTGASVYQLRAVIMQEG